MKRISFSQENAKRIYEWYLAVRQISPEESACAYCAPLGKRLKQFVGPAYDMWIKEQMRKYPYGKEHHD